MNTVGGRIRTLRLERKMNLPSLAEKSNLSKGLLSKLENSSAPNPSLETLHKIVKALDVTLSDLLDTEKVQVRRITPDQPPPWLEGLSKALQMDGKKLDEDILQALYVLQSRKGNLRKDSTDWLHVYKNLELSFSKQ